MPHSVAGFRTARIAVALAIAISARAAGAQWVSGVDALSPKAVADSQAVLRSLNDAVRKSPNDAALRHHVGMVAWVLSIRDEYKPPIGSLNGPLLRGLADSSLRLAAQMDQKNPLYELTLARFLRASSDAILRITAPTHVDRAVEAARTGADKSLLPAALTERGRLHWLMYDSESFETPSGSCSGISTSLNQAASDGGTTVNALKLLHNYITGCMRPGLEAGDGDYQRAEEAFREVYRAIPNDSAAFRRLAMVLAERGRWTELAAMSRDRVNRIPKDGWAWLSLGLALHRSGQSAHATAIFDTAMIRLMPAERDRMFGFQRLLTHNDSATYLQASVDRKKSWESGFWTMADPLWSREGNDPRTEFLSRVTFADLRWTVEEFQVRGADSDRGQIYIRYGPPDGIWQFRCQSDIGCGASVDQPQMGQFMALWDYNIGVTLVFWGAPTYGTAHFPSVDGPHIENVIDAKSAGFDNVAAEKIIPMPLRILRFRAPSDSVDLLVLSQAPADSIRAVTKNAVVTAHSWLLRRDNGGGIRDSAPLSASGSRRAVYRVSPATYMYRIETTAPGTLVAGRAMGWVNADRDTTSGFVLRGFGMSDILLSSPADPDKPLPPRWRGLTIAPLLGTLPRSSNLDIIWENYDLGARGGQSEYSVSVTFQRTLSKSGRVSAALLGIAASAVGVDRKDDRVTFKFDRVVPAATNAFVDRVSIGTGDTPPGDYIITLEITDKTTGRKTQRATALTIVQ